MKKIILAIMLTALIVFFLIACSDIFGTNEEETYTLSGKVYQEYTYAPIVGKEVFLWDYENEKRFSTFTNEQGKYAFNKVKAGGYIMYCRNEDHYSYFPWRYVISIKDEGFSNIDFKRYRC